MLIRRLLPGGGGMVRVNFEHGDCQRRIPLSFIPMELPTCHTAEVPFERALVLRMVENLVEGLAPQVDAVEGSRLTTWNGVALETLSSVNLGCCQNGSGLVWPVSTG